MMIRTTTKVIVEARIIPKMIPSTTPSVVSARNWFMYTLRMGFYNLPVFGPEQVIQSVSCMVA